MTVPTQWNTENVLFREWRASLDWSTQDTVESVSSILKTEGLTDYMYELLRTTLHIRAPFTHSAPRSLAARPLSPRQETERDFSGALSPRRKYLRILTLGIPSKQPPRDQHVHTVSAPSQSAWASLGLNHKLPTRVRYTSQESPYVEKETKQNNNKKTWRKQTMQCIIIIIILFFIFLMRET